MVKSTAAPASGSITVWDTGHGDAIRGFGLRIFAPTRQHPDGARAFFLNYRVDGTERRFTIGRYPDWTVEAARQEARELRRRIDRGDDPAGAKRERREAPTIGDLIDRYAREHLPNKRTKSQGRGTHLERDRKYRENDERRMLAHIETRLGKHMKVADVHGGDIKAMHEAITAGRGPIRANRILAIASKAFSLALVPMAGETRPWRDAAQGNPCKGIARNHEEERGQLFSQTQLAAIAEALAAYPGVAADCVRLIMFTGCRPSEAQNARWSEFDREPGCWVKPSAHTKQNKEHRLPLSPPALELVERLRENRSGEFLFPGQVPGEPLRALWHVWHHVRDEAKLEPDARLYDLRHTFASLGAGGGLSLPIIGRLLGHTQARTTQRYARHLADDPLRDAATKIAAVIAGAGDAGAKIVPLKGA